MSNAALAWWLTLTMILTVHAGASAQGVEAPSGGDPDPVVAVTIDVQQDLRPRGLPSALAWVRDMFKDAGVEIVWDAPPASVANRRLTISLMNSAQAPPELHLDAMGVAPSPGDGTRGTQAFVFVDLAMDYAAEHGVSPPHVLACAIAHELGHLLLPPNAHTGEGIMQSSWEPRQFPPRAAGLPGFPEVQARLLRRRAKGI